MVESRFNVRRRIFLSETHGPQKGHCHEKKDCTHNKYEIKVTICLFCTLVMQLNKLLIFLFFTLNSLSGFGQGGIFHAQFRSLLNGEPVLYARVVNAEGEVRLTNSDGYVAMPIKEK